MTVVTLCASCPAADPTLSDALSAALQPMNNVEFRRVECMSGCERPPSLAVRAEGKTAYLFGEMTTEDVPSLINFLELFSESKDGNLADARPLGALRFKALARIPG